MDGPGSLTDSLAESAQIEDTDRLEKDSMGRTCVEGVSQLGEDLVGGGWMECAVVILGIYCFQVWSCKSSVHYLEVRLWY